MSTGFHLFDPDDDDLLDNESARDYGWLVRFVRDEVRPFLVQHRQPALDALDRWFAHREEQHRRRIEREKQSWNVLAHQPKEVRNRRTPPAPGWTYGQYGFLTGPHRIGHQMIYGRGLGAGWLPPELSGAEPPLDDPLPPPSNRDLSPDECWAALLAVHDAARDHRERIGPADSIPYLILCRRVKELTEDHLPDLQTMLRSVAFATAAETPNRKAASLPASPKKRRRNQSPRQSRPLTPKETEALQLVGEHKGNITKAAQVAGKSRQAMKKLYEKGLKKLGRSAPKKPKTQPLPCDRRGQATVADREE